MAHLGKVVLFFSQGLRTGSRGQATNQKDQGQELPPVLSFIFNLNSSCAKNHLRTLQSPVLFSQILHKGVL
jgi:hypothetical protein